MQAKINPFSLKLLLSRYFITTVTTETDRERKGEREREKRGRGREKERKREETERTGTKASGQLALGLKTLPVQLAHGSPECCSGFKPSHV